MTTPHAAPGSPAAASAGSSSLLDGALARRLDRLTLVTRRRGSGAGQGDRRSRRRGASLEFADYRHYVPGDDPSRVDWNIYARTESLFVRVYEDETILNVHLVLDASRSMDWGEPNKLQFVRQVAAGLGYVALASSTRLSVWPLGAAGAPTYGPAWGRGRVGGLVGYLHHLLPAQAQTPAQDSLKPPPPDLGQALSSFKPRTPGLTLFLSDLLSPTWQAALSRLTAAGGEVVLLHVLAPDELNPSLGGDARLIDRESGAAVPVTLNHDALRLYAQHLSAWRADVQAYCARRDVTYVLLESSEPVEHVLFDTLRRRGVVR